MTQPRKEGPPTLKECREVLLKYCWHAEAHAMLSRLTDEALARDEKEKSQVVNLRDALRKINVLMDANKSELSIDECEAAFVISRDALTQAPRDQKKK